MMQRLRMSPDHRDVLVLKLRCNVWVRNLTEEEDESVAWTLRSVVWKPFEMRWAGKHPPVGCMNGSINSQHFLPHDAMHNHHVCHHVVGGCLSIAFVYHVEMAKDTAIVAMESIRKPYPSFWIEPFSMTLSDLTKYSMTRSIVRLLCDSRATVGKYLLLYIVILSHIFLFLLSRIIACSCFDVNRDPTNVLSRNPLFFCLASHISSTFLTSDHI